MFKNTNNKNQITSELNKIMLHKSQDLKNENNNKYLKEITSIENKNLSIINIQRETTDLNEYDNDIYQNDCNIGITACILILIKTLLILFLCYIILIFFIRYLQNNSGKISKTQIFE